MKDFFISYNRADRSWAEWIAWQLEEAGYTTVLQAWDFGASAHFVLKMDRALREAQRTIAVLSEDYLRALYTHPEWAAAFAQDPRGEKGMLAPVRVRECRVAGLLAVVAYIDLVGLDQEGARKALLEGVKRARAKPAERPAFPAEGRSAEGRPAFPGALPPVWNIPHLRNPNFTGREELLEAIEESLAGGERAALTQAITGLGGVGKTQLAVEYAYRRAGDCAVVWWVRAEGPAQLAGDYAGLAGALELAERDGADQRAVVEAVRRWLERNEGWLLIFDDAPSEAAVHDYLPRGGGGCVLVTSRDQSWGRTARPVAVREFARGESVEFVRRRTGREEGAEEVAEELGDFALALEQAAAYVEATGATLWDYLELFRTRRRELWEREEPPAGYPERVATTWALAMERTRAERPGAADLLNLCAFLAPDEIPLWLLREGARDLPRRLGEVAADPLALNEAGAALRRYSLVRVEGDSLSVHRLVQAVTRDRLEGEARREWAAAAARLVNAVFPFESDDVRTWGRCGRLLAHALSAAGHAEGLEVAAEATGCVLNQAGLYLGGRAEFGEARGALERALRISRRAYGPGHPQVARVLNNLGTVLKRIGDVGGARECAEGALAVCEKAYGPEHPEVAGVLSNLGMVLADMGDLAGARERLERALEIDERAYGLEHPTVATVVSNLGMVLKELGELAGARERFERTLATMERGYGAEHPIVATALSNLGMVFRALGDLAGARERLERALAIDEKAYGPEHPNVAIRLSNLGTVLADAGDPAGARERLERALAIDEKAYGPEHPNVAIRLSNLGTVLADAGDLAGARERLERALAIGEKAHGAEHPEVATDLSNLGSVLEEQGDAEGARACYERALGIYRKSLGEDHPDTRLVVEKLEALERGDGRGSEERR